jgi:hypothetical protein
MTTVKDEHEIYLGGTRFPIDRISARKISRYPDPVANTQTSYEFQKFMVNKTLTDMRGGLGIEEMGQVILDRFMWSSCNTLHDGHITLPPLATAVSPTAITMGTVVDGGLELPASSDPLTYWTHYHSDASITRETTNIKYGTYSTKLTIQPADTATTDAYIYQALATFDADLVSKWVSMSAWMRGDAGTQVSTHLGLQDTAGAVTWGGGVANDDAWHLIGYGKTFNVAADRCVLHARAHYGSGGTATGDDAYVDDIKGPCTTGGQVWCKFNGNTYFTQGTYLYRILDADGTITLLGSMPDVVTDMKVFGSCLYIACGLDSPYVYMSTAEAFTISVPSDDAGPEFFVEYDSTHLGKITSTGAFRYATAPNATASAWTACGAISDLTGATVKGLFMGPDATGTLIPYVVTTKGLYAADITNAKFLATGLMVPESEYNGFGYCYWRGDIYYSQGMNVLKYNPQAGTITEVGVISDDGLPMWTGTDQYISAFIPGRYRLYALSHVISRAGITTLYAYNGQGWHSYWTPGTISLDMHAGIVSDTYAYRLWFDWNSTIYWIAEEQNNLPPKKCTGSTYENETANIIGIHVYSGFNGGSKVYQKTGKAINLYLTDITADEPVAVSYKIDTAPTVLSSGWTTLTPTTTLADGVNEFKLGGTAGLRFYAIWIKVALTRGATDTKSPNIRALTISYLMDDDYWMWDCNIDTSKGYGAKSPKALEAALITCAKVKTFQEFIFMADATNETHYIKFTDIQGVKSTGQKFDGIYHIVLVEP